MYTVYTYMYVADSKQKMVQMVSKGSLEKGQSILRGPPYTVHRSEKVLTYFFCDLFLSCHHWHLIFTGEMLTLLLLLSISWNGKFACQMSHSFHDKDILIARLALLLLLNYRSENVWCQKSLTLCQFFFVPKKFFNKSPKTFSNFPCMSLNPNNFLQFEF